MAIHPLRQKLRFDKKYNPFHDDFDEALVTQMMDEKWKEKEKLSNEEILLIATAQSALSLNLSFKETYAYLADSFNKINLTYEEVIAFSIAIRNRTCWLINQESMERALATTERRYEDAFRQKVLSSEPSIGKLDAQAALETEVDALNTILNYLRYYKEKLPAPDPKIEKLKPIQEIQAQIFAGTFYYVLKSAYDDAVWRDGFAHLNFDEKVLKIEFQNTRLLTLYKVGIFRLNRNATAIFLAGKSVLDQIGEQAFENVNPYRRKNLRIRTVKVSNGYLKYQLGDGNDRIELLNEMDKESSLMAYYSYLRDVELPKLPGLNLKTILGMFSLLNHLFKRALLLEINDKGVFKKSDLFRYPYRIKATDLVSYLVRRSTLEQAKILQVLIFFENGDKVNFWDKPFLRIGDDMYFLSLPLSFPNILYLIDTWLEDGGYNVDERGKYFESYIKEELNQILTTKKFQYHIPQKSKFYNLKNEFEEIDLVLNLKSVCIVAEVKCIRYPFEPREISNALLRLEKGASQAKRKAAFITKHATELKGDIGDLDGKEIIPLVITNYPIFTSHVIDAVPIVDFFLVEAYCDTGKLSFGKLITEGGKEMIHEVINETIFYKDEDEFCVKFLENMLNPPAVTSMMESIELKFNRITTDSFNLQVFVQAAEFKEL